MPDDNGDSVRYTVKELIAKLDQKLDTLFALIATKAASDEFVLMGKRVEQLELDRATNKAVKRMIYILVLVAIPSLIGSAVAIIQLFQK